MARQREQWGTRLGVILAVAGSAVGLGNFLRFPGQAALNGGGAFMIPYFCALIFLGIPICWAEWAMGKYGGRHGYHSYPAIFELMGRRPIWRFLGVIGLLIPIIIYMYYVLIESWCLAYAYLYLTGGVTITGDAGTAIESSRDFFRGLVGATQDGLMMEGTLHISVIFWLITFALNFIIVYRGVTRGIERFCLFAMPLLILIAIVVLVRVLTLPPVTSEVEVAGALTVQTRSVVDGLGFMWNPKAVDGGGSWLSALANPQVWLASAGQIFFTLSVGFGIIANYASYMRPKDDVALSGLTASATNEFCEVCLGGLITIPAAFLFLGAVQISGALDSSFALGFHTLPVVFLYMPAGRLIGAAWFFMLFLAAITSSLSMLQPAIAFLEEGLEIGRRLSVTILGLVTALGSLFVIFFSKDLVALDIMDFWIGSFALFILAIVEVLLFSWIFGAKRGFEIAMEGSEIRIPRAFIIVIKYISPAYLLVVLIGWTVINAPGYLKRFSEAVPAMTLGLILGTFVFLLVLAHLAGRRWRAVGTDPAAETGFQADGEGTP